VLRKTIERETAQGCRISSFVTLVLAGGASGQRTTRSGFEAKVHMRREIIAALTTVIAWAGFFGIATDARADAFKSAKDCVPGRRVADKAGNKGTVQRIDKWSETSCDVLMDGTGKESIFIFWMLHAEGGSAETDDKLVPGTYECFANLRYTFMDVHITGPNTYESAGVRGKFHVEPSRKIIFESGSLSKYNSKLLTGPSIGLNTGGSFWGTTCELKKK
jgi:hypothetical protein